MYTPSNSPSQRGRNAADAGDGNGGDEVEERKDGKKIAVTFFCTEGHGESVEDNKKKKGDDSAAVVRGEFLIGEGEDKQGSQVKRSREKYHCFQVIEAAVLVDVGIFIGAVEFRQVAEDVAGINEEGGEDEERDYYYGGEEDCCRIYCTPSRLWRSPPNGADRSPWHPL